LTPRRQPANQAPEAEPVLRVPRSQLDHEIGERLALGEELLGRLPNPANMGVYIGRGSNAEGVTSYRHDFYTWDEYNEQLLRSRFSTGKVADQYRMIVVGGGSGTPQQEIQWLQRDVNGQMRNLKSIRQRLSLYESEAEGPGAQTLAGGDLQGMKIFVVHGHDGDVKLQVAEYLQSVTGERPVILHEQPDSGRTIIEKFEAHASEAGFAVVLLTADDEGSAKSQPPNPRARQNVVLELGYFLGRLGRARVVALYETGVELPSDLNGVLYKPLSGNWHTELARELRAAGINADLSKLK
jgi:predicted nucleotide-binding protein